MFGVKGVVAAMATVVVAGVRGGALSAFYYMRSLRD